MRIIATRDENRTVFRCIPNDLPTLVYRLATESKRINNSIIQHSSRSQTITCFGIELLTYASRGFISTVSVSFYVFVLFCELIACGSIDIEITGEDDDESIAFDGVLTIRCRRNNTYQQE